MPSELHPGQTVPIGSAALHVAFMRESPLRCCAVLRCAVLAVRCGAMPASVRAQGVSPCVTTWDLSSSTIQQLSLTRDRLRQLLLYETADIASFSTCLRVMWQEYFLMALSQPRQEESSSSSSGSEQEEGDVDAELEHLDSPAARMYHKSMIFQQDQKRIREEVTKRKRSAFKIPVGCCASPLPSCQPGAPPGTIGGGRAGGDPFVLSTQIIVLLLLLGHSVSEASGLGYHSVCL